MANRYSVIEEGWAREIVLLQGLPCVWGKCTFCDYIEDNCADPEQCHIENTEALSKVSGCYDALEVINSGSCFELPDKTVEMIKEVALAKGIAKISFESHWLYRNKFSQWRERFADFEVVFKVGIETFDDDFRNNILCKGGYFQTKRDLAQLVDVCDSVCLLVGVVGQTKEMITTDIEILTNNFPLGCVNVFVENSTDLQADLDLIAWFYTTYGNLEDYPNIDVLYHNEDFGVSG
ncbi:MAG: hypothetical protein OCC45_06085 [Desulfotalea sp.]